MASLHEAETIETMEPDSPPGEARARHFRITERDACLIKLLADVRFLSMHQIWDMVFGEISRSTVTNRLSQLAGERGVGLRPPLYKWRCYEPTGRPYAVFSLTEAGYVQAAQWQENVRQPLKLRDVKATYISHVLATNALWLGVLKPRQGPVESPRLSGLRWRSADVSMIPCGEFNPATGEIEDRLVRPDAALDVRGSERRIFIEWESGSNALEKDVRAATSSKLDRYHIACFGLVPGKSGVTWYAQEYPDSYAPELLFVTPSEERRDSIRALARKWRAKSASKLVVDALTVPEAISVFRKVAGQPVLAAQATSNSPLTKEELVVLERFAVEAISTIKKVRHQVRAQQPVSHEPEYPASYEAFQKVCRKLRDAVG